MPKCKKEKTEILFPGFEPDKQTWDFPVILNGYINTLTGGEFKVLWYIVRHTYGWQKTEDTISYKQFQEGIKKKDDTWLDRGVGLGTQAISQALKNLEKKGFIEIDKKRYRGRQGITHYKIRFKNTDFENQNQSTLKIKT